LKEPFRQELLTTKHPQLTEETLRNKLNEIEEKRSSLIETGLLDKDENPDFQVHKTLMEQLKTFYQFILKM
jgi:uncharacterized protein YfkK (UPF0435 family)